MPRYGWEPVVVCAEEHSVYNTPIDSTLIELVPSDTKVVRVKSVEPKIALALAGKVAPFLLYLPDTALGWYQPAYKKALALLKEVPFDLILSCAYARTSNLVGLKLKRKTGLAWIAYFSDPWVDSLGHNYDPITGYINRRMERAVIAGADAVIFISEGMRQLIMKKYPREWLGKSFVVSQCYDPELVSSAKDYKTELGGDKFTLTFTGMLYGGLRSLTPLFQAIRNILNKYPDIYRHMAIQIVGGVRDTHRRLIREFGIEDMVSVVGTVPYLESLAYMAKADVLLSLDSPSRGSIMLHPSKVAEYLGFKKPILAITPLDAGWVPVIRRLGGIVVSPEDIDGIEKAIMTLYQDYNQGNLSKYSYSDKDIEAYNAINAVGNLAQIFDWVIQRFPKGLA
jgi:glycosyltransferase involved in cell wall biosynthesis